MLLFCFSTFDLYYFQKYPSLCTHANQNHWLQTYICFPSATPSLQHVCITSFIYPLINCLTKHLSSLWSQNVCLNQMLTSDSTACWTVLPIMCKNLITIKDAEAGIIHFFTDIWLIAMAHVSCRDIAHSETEWVVSNKWWKDYLLNSRIGRHFYALVHKDAYTCCWYSGQHWLQTEALEVTA